MIGRPGSRGDSLNFAVQIFLNPSYLINLESLLMYVLHTDAAVLEDSIPGMSRPTETQTDTIIDELFERYNNALRQMSLAIHEFKEVAFEEKKSSKLLSDFLQDEGFVVERGIAGDETAFVAHFTQGDGPVVSFNAVFSLTFSNLNSRNMTHFPG